MSKNLNITSENRIKQATQAAARGDFSTASWLLGPVDHHSDAFDAAEELRSIMRNCECSLFFAMREQGKNPCFLRDHDALLAAEYAHTTQLMVVQ